MQIYQIDAFTNQLFEGNYAAVCPLNEWINDEILQNIAIENNYPETAFFIPDGDNFHLRWFTPAYEVDLCGHATLATAHMIFNHTDYDRNEIIFNSKSGKLTVTKQDDGWLQMDFPTLKLAPISTSEALIKGLGATPIEVYKSMDVLAVFETEAEVAALNPDFRLLKTIDTRGIIATAKGDKVDFISRFFAPAAGVDEDPVTGSAHSQLTPYWSNKLNKNKLNARQISKRGGKLRCEMKGNRVLISGQAVTYLIGEIMV
jgi:PhzF family phenazine biosynthesis protein